MLSPRVIHAFLKMISTEADIDPLEEPDVYIGLDEIPTAPQEEEATASAEAAFAESIPRESEIELARTEDVSLLSEQFHQFFRMANGMIRKVMKCTENNVN